MHSISDNWLSLAVIEELIAQKKSIQLTAQTKEKINKCRTYLDTKIQNTDTPIYGINTGFGSLYKKNISTTDLEKLQVNLMMSHACGIGKEVPIDIVHLMILLKIQSLCYGNSGVQVETVQRLIDFFNHKITPVVYEQGSLGASGDLAPLAHLCLPLINMGEVYQDNVKISSSVIYKKYNWEPISLKAKEGLALLNGTQFMSSYAIFCVIKAKKIINLANTIAALSIDAFDGRIEAFDSRLHQTRPHKGQQQTAEEIRKKLQGSEIIQRPKKHVQDPYSFRCIPQVHGASWDTIDHVEKVVTTEINSVTDNPVAFPDDDVIISGGNFHGQPLALVLDFLAIAVAELGNISERRIYQLISGARELPEFLIQNPGLDSGLMIPQYTAASIVSQNKQLCTPASIDSIVSSNGQEDHVSMGANAATKAYQIIENVEKILAIELLTACQAMEFRRPLRSSPLLENIITAFRKQVPALTKDRLLHIDIKRSIEFIQDKII